MTAAEARYYRASRSCHTAWANGQPQYVIPGVLDQVEPSALGLIEPTGSQTGAEPSRATPEALTAHSAAPPATPNAGGSAPLTNNGRDALLSGNERRGQEVTLDVR